MQDFVSDHYLWFKAFHLIAVMAWMAGLLYLPRLFVYHAEAGKGMVAETFKIMESRLLRIIMNPAMIVTWSFGLTLLLSNRELMTSGWMHAKLLLVVLMTVFHMQLAKWRRELQNGHSTRTPKFFRRVNEVPTVLMIAIVILAVTKPF